MGIDGEVISDTLEQVAAKIGDPAERVFAALFAQYPHYEEMFVMDTGGQVRGSMLETCLACLLGVAESDSETPRFLIEASRLTHDGFGLEDGEIDRIFFVMRDVFRNVLGPDWGAAAEREWAKLLVEIAKIGHG